MSTLQRVAVQVRNEKLWEVECAGKDVYPSEAAALAALALLRKDGGMRRTCWLNGYACSSCGQWHIGNHQ